MKIKRKAPTVAPTTIGAAKEVTHDPDLILIPLPKQARPRADLAPRPHKTLHRTPEGYVLVTWPQGRPRWVGSTFPEASRIVRELQDQDKLPVDREGAL